VYNVLLTNMVRSVLFRPVDGCVELVEQVWTHLVRSAPLARWAAPGFDVDPEAAFSLGLLHDVGKLILFDRLSALRERQRRPVRVSLELVRRALRELHEPLGGLAMAHWKLGEDAARVIATHHRRPPPEKPDRMNELVHVVERVDIAEARGETLDWDALWSGASLTADAAVVKALLSEAVV
jgi:HD-like signal output (HDOD) protein